MEVNKKTRIYVAIVVVICIILGLALSAVVINFIKKSSFNSAYSDLVVAVKDSFPGHNSVSYEERTVHVKVWSDGMYDIAKKAAAGGPAYIDAWNENRDTMYVAICSIVDRFLFADADIYFYLVSEYNIDSELLVFKNKTCVYDSVAAHLNGG